MNKNYLFKFYIMLAAFVMSLTACTDYDNNYDERKLAYEEAFKDVFGNIDPNQDWNMAEKITADVNVERNINGTLEIYTESPSVYGSQLLARTALGGGKANVSFDVVKGTKNVYVTILDANKEAILASVSPIKNGRLTGPKFAPGGGETCPVTRTEETVAVRHNKSALINKFLETGASSWTAYNNLPEGQKLSTGGDYPQPISAYPMNQNDANSQETANIPNMYKLTGVDFSHKDDGHVAGDIRPIFGTYTNKYGEATDGVFMEGKDHIDQYVRTGILGTDVTFTVKETGPVELDFMWRGTDFCDVFGYYYYTDNNLTSVEWWNDVEKYILFDKFDSDPTKSWIGGKQNTSTLTQLKEWNAGTSSFNAIKDMNGADTYNFGGWDDKTTIYGTKIKLAHFDASGNASYTFDAGTKIGFFLIRPNSANTGYDPYRFFISDTNIDYEQFFHVKGYAISNDIGRESRPYAATFNYNRKTYVGFADESGDCDLNDIVFTTSNTLPEPPDITPDDLPEPETASWIVACEDLGASDDIDFNDVVFKVAHVGGEEKITVTPLAAGGSLASDIYYDGKSIGEIHQLFGMPAVATGSYTFVNTTGARSRKGTPKTIGATNCDITSTIPSDFSMASWLVGKNTVDDAESMGGFAIITHQLDGDGNALTAIKAPESGKVPQMICVPAMYKRPGSTPDKVEKGDWSWPIERTGIAEAYNEDGHKFADWVGDASSTDWYNYYTVGKVITGTKAEVTGSMEEPDHEDPVDVDGRTPMTAGQTYNFNVSESGNMDVSYNGNEYYKVYLSKFANTLYKLPSDLPDNATGTLTINFSNNYYNNMDVFDSTGLHLFTLTNGGNAGSKTITVAQMKSLLKGLSFFVACSSDAQATGASFVINQ